MADVVIQAQSTLFNRQGTTTQYKRYNLPTILADLLVTAYRYSSVPQSVSDAAQIALLRLLGQNAEVIPGGQTLFNVHDLTPDLFNGAAELEAIYQQDPFSDEYETETEDLFERSYLVARAAAQTGPANVRGGTARQAFELAELDNLQSINRFREIWQNKLATAAMVIQAVQVSAAAENARWGLQLQAQQQQAATEQGLSVQTLSAIEQIARDREAHLRTLAAGAEFLGIPVMETGEVLQGEGFQGGITTGFGMSSWR